MIKKAFKCCATLQLKLNKKTSKMENITSKNKNLQII